MTSPSTRACTVRQHDGGGDRWRMIAATPAPALARVVTSYCAYTEQTASFSARRELAATTGVLLFNLGESIELTGADGYSLTLRCGEAFVAGVADGTSISRSGGSQAGLHVSAPLATLAAAIGAPAAEIANRVVRLGDIAGAVGDIGSRLLDAADTEQQFRLLDRFLEGRLAAAPRVDHAVRWAQRRLDDAEPPRVSDLAREIGWSRKHFAARFRAVVGIAPDVYRRLARFERFWRSLRAAPAMPLAGLAAVAGYHDQAHLSRDVRAFGDMTPGELRARLIPGQGGVRDD